MSRRRPRSGLVPRWIAGTLGLLVLAGAIFIPSARYTDADWTDSEHAKASFTAMTVPAPIATSACVTSGGLLGANPTVTVYWRVPAAAAGYSVQYGRGSTAGLLEPLLTNLLQYVTTTPTGDGYTTVFGSGVLTGLLGASTTVGIRFQHPSGWTSAWLSAHATLGPLGSNPTCNVSPPP